MKCIFLSFCSLFFISTASAEITMYGTSQQGDDCLFSVNDDLNVRFSWQQEDDISKSISFAPTDYDEGTNFQEYIGSEFFMKYKLKVYMNGHGIIYEAHFATGILTADYHTVCTVN